jgi:hypothetical protein
MFFLQLWGFQVFYNLQFTMNFLKTRQIYHWISEKSLIKSTMLESTSPKWWLDQIQQIKNEGLHFYWFFQSYKPPFWKMNYNCNNI